MPIERSHGKARPTLPRSSDLRLVPADAGSDRERTRSRDARGRFTSGNTAAIGRGAKATARRILGRVNGLTDAEALTVCRDAVLTLAGSMRDLPHDGSIVRHLAALHAHHVARAAFWSARATAAGLGTEEGIKAEERASKHGARVERLTVTMLDVATRLAAARRAGPLDAAGWAELVAEGGKPRERDA